MASRPQDAMSNGPSERSAPPPTKRVRVALACERCKTRKQKCDGRHPACSKCHRLGIACQYVIPSKPMPFGRNRYLAALERRVRELEGFLAERGLLDQVSDFTPYDLSDNTATSTTGVDSQPQEDTRLNERPQTGASSQGGSDLHSSDHEEGESMLHILRDLSLESNGGYIGATSHFTMGRLVSSIAQGKRYDLGGQSQQAQSNLCHPNMDASPELLLSDVRPDTAEKLLRGYIKHVATRYPVLQTNWIRELSTSRHRVDIPYERCVLHLVYAIAGRFLETTGETSPDFCPERHQAEVYRDLEEVLEYHDTRSVVVLVLLAVLSLRAEGGPGAWAYIGLAMRIAIDLGLHRQTAAMSQIGFEVEMRKRLFWSCYTMDRQISIPLGRPFSIADFDIDVALPFDVDESCQDLSMLRHAASLDPNTPAPESTSLTAFLHILRLRRLESSIQQSIYRVDQAVHTTDEEVDHYLVQLERWRDLIPLDARRRVDQDSVAFDGFDYYLVFYYKCHRLLLYPLISRPHASPRYLKMCADVCGGVAQTYKRLHQSLSVGYSLMALQTVFMAGLTLVYCVWISPDVIFSSAVSNDINACSIVLFVITERWPAAKKYRDAFETLKQTAIDPLAGDRNPEPRRAIGALPAVELPLNEGRAEYSSIVTHMSGQALGEVVTEQPDIIGTEQVQYQMGQRTASHDIGSRTGASNGAQNAAGSDATIAAATNDIPVLPDLDMWSVNAFQGGMDYNSAFDLAGCSADMGWVSDGFTATRANAFGSHQMME